MQKLPKLTDYPAPPGYFEELPEKILAKATRPKIPSIWNWAAAAAIVLGISLWQLQGSDEKTMAPLSEDEIAILYIESGQWDTQDVLSLSDDPNALLDQIIEEEFTKSTPLWNEEETWF